MWSFLSLAAGEVVLLLATLTILYQLILQNVHNRFSQQQSLNDDPHDGNNESISSPNNSTKKKKNKNKNDSYNNSPFVHSPPPVYKRNLQKRHFSLRLYIVLILLLIYTSLRLFIHLFDAVYVEREGQLPNAKTTPVTGFKIGSLGCPIINQIGLLLIIDR